MVYGIASILLFGSLQPNELLVGWWEEAEAVAVAARFPTAALKLNLTGIE